MLHKYNKICFFLYKDRRYEIETLKKQSYCELKKSTGRMD